MCLEILCLKVKGCTQMLKVIILIIPRDMD